jgi:hypothetical protein
VVEPHSISLSPITNSESGSFGDGPFPQLTQVALALSAALMNIQTA